MKNQSLEGLRGVAALVVVLSHLSLTFWPGTHTTEAWATPTAWQSWLFNSPFTFLYSGTFAVCIFFVMSGYVLSKKFFRTGDRGAITDLFVRRYFRLMPPVLVSLFIGYIFLKYGLLLIRHEGTPVWMSWTYTTSPSMFGAVKDGLWRAFFLDGIQSYNPVAWTMKIEFVGSMLTFASCILLQKLPHRWIAYVIAIVLCARYLNGSLYYGLFFVGIWLADAAPLSLGKWPSVVMLVLGLWLGGYYSGSYSHAVMDSIHINLFGVHLETYQICNFLAGTLIVIVALYSSLVASFLSRFKELGRRSFSLYLIHFHVIASAGLATFFLFRPAGYNASAIIASLISLILAYVASGWYATHVDERAVKFSRHAGDFILRRFRLRNGKRKDVTGG